MNTKDTIDVIKYHYNIEEGLFKSVVELLERGEEYKRILEHVRVITTSEQVKDIIDNTILGG